MAQLPFTSSHVVIHGGVGAHINCVTEMLKSKIFKKVFSY